MKLGKKAIIIGIMCIVVIAGTLGGFAIASADDNGTTTPPVTTTIQTDLFEKVAEMYQQDTGTVIDPAALQKAFAEANQAIQMDRIDQMLQKLVEAGKITPEQAEEWKTWLNARPSSMLSDEFKSWLESRPEIPGLAGPGLFGKGMMPFGNKGTTPFGGMHRFGLQGDKVDPGIRGCLPAFNS